MIGIGHGAVSIGQSFQLRSRSRGAGVGRKLELNGLACQGCGKADWVGGQPALQRNTTRSPSFIGPVEIFLPLQLRNVEFPFLGDSSLTSLLLAAKGITLSLPPGTCVSTDDAALNKSVPRRVAIAG
jgi:hypothetical protein